MLSIKKKKKLRRVKKPKQPFSARRSVYAKKEIKKGHTISSNDLINLRPKIGVCSSRFFNLVGKKLNKSKKNDPIFIRDISDE